MLQERSAYDLFESIGDKETLSPLGRAVFGAIGEYYTLDTSVRSCQLELIETRMLGRIQNSKHAKPLKDYCRGLEGSSSGANVEAHIRELHRRCVDGKLSLALANGQSEEEIQKLIAERSRSETARAVSGGPERLIDVLDTADLTSEDTSNVNYIKLWPKALNDRLDGGALRGHHILVFARPETGKTTFIINLYAGFAAQQLAVLGVHNEEPVADVRDRFRGRLLKTSKASVRGNRAETARRLAAMELGSLRITEGTTFSAARQLLSSSGPYDVVIFDQIRNMRLKSDSRTAELEAAGIEARSIAKDFNVLVISVTQAGDSATNKVYLGMSDVDSSKTGLPASADLMVGLGSDESMKLNSLMGASLPKNKLSGIHENFTMSVNFSTGVIE